MLAAFLSFIPVLVGSAIGYWLYKSKVRRFSQFLIICGVMVNLVMGLGVFHFARNGGWIQNLSNDWFSRFILIFSACILTMLGIIMAWSALVLTNFLHSHHAERRKRVAQWTD